MPQLWTDIKTHAIPWKAVKKFCRRWVIVNFICTIALVFLGSILWPLGLLFGLWICTRQIDPLLDKQIGRYRWLMAAVAGMVIGINVGGEFIHRFPIDSPPTRIMLMGAIDGGCVALGHLFLQGNRIRGDLGRRLFLVFSHMAAFSISIYLLNSLQSISNYNQLAITILFFPIGILFNLLTGLPIALIQKELRADTLDRLPAEIPLTEPHGFRNLLIRRWKQIVFYPAMLAAVWYLNDPLLIYGLNTMDPPYHPAIAKEGQPLPELSGPITLENARKMTPLAHWNYDESSSLSGGMVRELKFSSDNRSLWVSSDPHNQIYLWSLETGTFTATIPGYGFGINADNQLLVTSVAETTTLYHTSDWKEIFSTKESPRHFRFSPDGTLLAGAGYGEKILLQHLPDGSQVAELPPAYSIEFNADGSILASGDSEGTVRIWRIADLKLLHAISTSTTNSRTDKNSVDSLSFSPQSNLLASGNHDGKIYLWSVETGQLVHALDNKYAIEEMHFNIDGTVLATLSEYNGLKLWNISSGRILTEYNNENFRFWNMDISPDGTLIALGNWTSNEIVILGVPKRN